MFSLVSDLCERLWKPHQDNPEFVRAVADALGLKLSGDADEILNYLRHASDWRQVEGGPTAAEMARAGYFVVVGLEGPRQSVPAPHGHVAIVVDGPLGQGRFPVVYAASIRNGGRGTINWLWVKEDRERLVYFAHEIQRAVRSRADSK